MDEATVLAHFSAWLERSGWRVGREADSVDALAKRGAERCTFDGADAAQMRAAAMSIRTEQNVWVSS